MVCSASTGQAALSARPANCLKRYLVQGEQVDVAAVATFAHATAQTVSCVL
jgi:hypothetical protein